MIENAQALAWCPWQSSLLATGGGANDKTIHFWQTTTGARLNSLKTDSQVTSLNFSPHARELVSTHGFPENQLSIWAYPGLTKVADVKQAHETRVLHSALGPDGCTLATASSDEVRRLSSLMSESRSEPRAEPQILEHLCPTWSRPGGTWLFQGEREGRRRIDSAKAIGHSMIPGRARTLFLYLLHACISPSN